MMDIVVYLFHVNLSLFLRSDSIIISLESDYRPLLQTLPVLCSFMTDLFIFNTFSFTTASFWLNIDAS